MLGVAMACPAYENVAGTGLEQDQRKFACGWLYLLGALFAVGGIAGFAVSFASSIGPDFRIILPGSHRVAMVEGDYTLFYEFKTVLNGQSVLTSITVPQMRIVMMTPEETGVKLEVSGLDTGYDKDGIGGYSVLEFSIESEV